MGHRHRRPAGPHGRHRLSRRAVEVAGHGGFRLPHRVDDQELHRDRDPEASRRRQAVARRSGREVRAGDEEPRLPDDRLAEAHRPPSPVARRGVPRGQPVGRPAARGHRRAVVRDDQGGHSVLQCPRDRVRVLQLRLRDSRAHRRKYRGSFGLAAHGCLYEVRLRARPEVAGHGVDNARAFTGARRSSRARLPLGGQPVEERTAARERIVRIDGRHADDAVRPRPIRRRVPRRMAAARRRRGGSDPALLAARNAAGVAPGAGRCVEERREDSAQLRRLRLRSAHLADMRVPDRRRARRRPSRLRHADALAAGIRRRADRVRQSHVYELAAHVRRGARCARAHRRPAAPDDRAVAGARRRAR